MEDTKEKELQKIFDAYVEAYTYLNIDDKRHEIINKLKIMISEMMIKCQEKGISCDLLINKELTDLNDDPLSEKDFLEGVFVYIHTLEDIINRLVSK